MEETKLIEILKKKEEEIEVFLEEARKKAETIVEDAKREAARVEASYRDEIKELEVRLLREEERNKREVVEKIMAEMEGQMERIRKRAEERRSNCLEVIRKEILRGIE